MPSSQQEYTEEEKEKALELSEKLLEDSEIPKMEVPSESSLDEISDEDIDIEMTDINELMVSEKFDDKFMSILDQFHEELMKNEKHRQPYLDRLSFKKFKESLEPHHAVAEIQSVYKRVSHKNPKISNKEQEKLVSVFRKKLSHKKITNNSKTFFLKSVEKQIDDKDTYMKFIVAFNYFAKVAHRDGYRNLLAEYTRTLSRLNFIPENKEEIESPYLKLLLSNFEELVELIIDKINH